MGSKIHNMEDVRMYLNGCICLYKGEPVYVSVEGPMPEDHVNITTLGRGGRESTVKYTEANFDYRSAPLGYMFISGQAIYVERYPTRKTKQGIHQENTWGRSTTGQTYYIADYILSDAFKNCILGTHMSETEAITLLKGAAASSIPVSRHIAISNDKDKLGLWYKGRRIGSKGLMDSAFILDTSEYSSFMHRTIQRHVTIC